MRLVLVGLAALPAGGLVATAAQGFVATAAQGQSCETVASDSIAIRGVAEGIVRADNARDLDRVLGYYAPDAVLYPPGESSVRGRASIRPRYEALFADFDPAIVTDLETIEVCGDMALVVGRNGGLLKGRVDSPDRPLSDVFVMVLTRLEGTWLIQRLIWHSEQR